MKVNRIPTEAERLEKYFDDLRRLLPDPPRNWAANAKECRWAKILKEKDKNPDVSGE